MIRLATAAAALLATAWPAAAGQRSFAVADFERIRVSGNYDVVVATGQPTTLAAEGSSAALAAIDVRVDAGTLSIRPRQGAAGAGEPVSLRIGAPRLLAAAMIGRGTLRIDRMAGDDVRLTLNGDGELEVGTIAAPRLSAVTSGAGRLALGGAVERAIVGAIGAPRIEADALVVRDLSLNAQGAGAIALRATGVARVIADGPSQIVVRGGAECNVSGSAAEVDC